MKENLTESKKNISIKINKWTKKYCLLNSRKFCFTQEKKKNFFSTNRKKVMALLHMSNTIKIPLKWRPYLMFKAISSLRHTENDSKRQ